MVALNAYGLTTRSPHAYFKDALLLIQNQQIPEALQAIDAAIVFSNNCPFYIYQKIRLLHHLGAYKSCSELIVSQLEYLYKHASLYILCRILDYLQKMNHYDLAQLQLLLKHHLIPSPLASSYYELLTLKKKPFYELAKKAMVQDDYSLCLCYCQLYLKLYPAYDEVIYMKAYAYHMLGDLITSCNNYLDYLKMQPQNPDAYIHLGLIYMELGEYDVAIKSFQNAHTLEPMNKQHLSYLGECYYVYKKFDLAIATYLEIAKLDPNDLQNYFNLSHTYEKISKKRLSRRYLRRIKKQLKKRH